MGRNAHSLRSGPNSKVIPPLPRRSFATWSSHALVTDSADTVEPEARASFRISSRIADRPISSLAKTLRTVLLAYRPLLYIARASWRRWPAVVAAFKNRNSEAIRQYNARQMTRNPWR